MVASALSLMQAEPARLQGLLPRSQRWGGVVVVVVDVVVVVGVAVDVVEFVALENAKSVAKITNAMLTTADDMIEWKLTTQ